MHNSYAQSRAKSTTFFETLEITTRLESDDGVGCERLATMQWLGL